MSDKAKGWMVTLAGLGINLALGVLYTWSVVTSTLTTKLKLDGAGMPIPGTTADGAAGFISITPKGEEKAVAVAASVLQQQAYNWDAKAALLPYALALLFFAIMMAFAGRAQDKFGPRWVATLGGVFVGAGMLLASTNNMSATATHWPILLGFGVLTGCGIGMAYACATPAAIKWFHPSQKGLITGLVVAGFGLASVYTAPLTKALIASGGPQGMFRILGIAFLVAIVVLAQLLQNPPAGYTPVVPAKVAAAAAAGTAPAAPGRDYDWTHMIKTPQFYLLWVMYGFVAFAGLMMIGIISKVAPEQLADPTFSVKWGFTLTVALAIGNGAGRPIVGIISDKIGRTKSMIAVFLSQALFVGLILQTITSERFGQQNALILLLLVAAGIGFNYGANLTVFPAATADFFGTKNMGVNYGLVFTAWGVGGAIGNYAAGWIKDATGSFGMAYIIAAVLCIIAAGLTFVVKAPKHDAIEAA